MKPYLLITAAGLSERFHSDKLLYPINKIPMGVYCLRFFAQFDFCGKCIVTSEERSYLIKEAEKLGYEVCINPDPEKGLGSSVSIGVKAILRSQQPRSILFATADMPYLSSSAIDLLIASAQVSPDHICALGRNGIPQKPVVFPSAFFQELDSCRGDIGGRTIIKAHPELVKVIEASERELRDVDSPEDLLPS